MFLKCLLVVLLLAIIHVEEAFGVACANKPGVTFKSCNGGSGGGGPGSAPIIQHKLVECCKGYLFTGPGSGHYEFSAGSPFVITIRELTIAAGETIEIRIFKCDPDGDCHYVVIDGTATLPIALTMNGPRFSIRSTGNSPPTMRFTVCNGSPNCCPSGWDEYEGCCYKIFNLGLQYFANEAKCVQESAHLAAPQTANELRFMLDFIRNLNQVAATGTHTLNLGQTWQNTDGSSVNHALWIPGRPIIFNSHYTCSCIQYNYFGVYNCHCTWGIGYPALCKKCYYL